MNVIETVRAECGSEWLPSIYAQRVRKQRTRSFHFEIPAKQNSVEILYTLLGIELKIGRRRVTVPDLATARYLCVFARIGCRDVAIPYDISKISAIADGLETSWQNTVLRFEMLTKKQSRELRSRSRSRLIKAIREEIAAIGEGEVMPKFDRETRFRDPK